MSTVDQYRKLLEQQLNVELEEMAKRVVEIDLPIEAYRSATGYIAGMRRALAVSQEAHDKLYGREPSKDKYEDPYG